MSKYISYDYPDTFVIFLYSYSLLKGKYVVESRILADSFHILSAHPSQLKHRSTLRICGRVTQICVFNTVKLGTSASYP